MESNSDLDKTKKQSPWSWIPTLYFAEGIPYVIAMTVSVIMYKRLGISNTDIALYTSWLYLPWVLKFVWSPFIDIIKTKRWWILLMQLFIGAGLAGVAFLIPGSLFFKATLAVFWLMAFSSATHDIAADGFYMLALDSSQQSFFVGIRSTFYRLAMITGQGLLIILAGFLEISTGTQPLQFNISTLDKTGSKVIQNDKKKNSVNSETVFKAFPSELVLSTNKITEDSLNTIKNHAINENKKNGFIHIDKVTQSQSSNKLVGNASIVKIKLLKSPEKGKEMVLNTSFNKGDKSIHIVSGERLVFNSSNWNKPAYIVIGLDDKLVKSTNATFESISGNFPLAWSITFYILAGFFLLIFIYHRFALPRPITDSLHDKKTSSEIIKEFVITFKTFFKKKGIVLAIVFLLLYRLGEALLVKMASPFLLDTRDIGGLGLSTQEVGFVYGTVGIISLTLGGIVGGIAASMRGLKFWIWPMALAITLPHLAYIYLSYMLPQSFFWINMAVAIEQFGYGFGFTAYMLFMIYFSDGEHKTAHFAICTGFMAASMMLPGMIAGWLQELWGYQHFFLFIVILSIPTLAIIPFMKIEKDFGKKKKEE